MIPSTVVCDAVLNVLLLDIHHIKYENAGMSAVVCGREMYFHILNLNYFYRTKSIHQSFKIQNSFIIFKLYDGMGGVRGQPLQQHISYVRTFISQLNNNTTFL
jgi:hypothetical protein